MGTKAQAVKGQIIRKPRLTGWGVWRIVTRLVLPFLGVLTLLDLLLYLLFRYGFDQCYGVWCWF